MQKRIAAFIITGFLLSTALSSIAGETRNHQGQELSNFEFVVALEASGISFESHHGTNWLTLSWGTSAGSESNFWVDESGIAARESSMSGHRFLVHVSATPGKIEFKSKKGASWKELSQSTTDSRQWIVNEYGKKREGDGR